MKCFYHNDLDGRCAAFWVLKENPACTCIPINYGIDFPFETIGNGERIYIVDYSIQPTEMEQLLAITQDVIWIDHHISAINRYQGFGSAIKGIRYNGISGCMLTYLYFNVFNQRDVDSCEIQSAREREEANIPWFTKYIDDRDVWTFNYGNQTKFFTIAFYIYDFLPTDHVWEEMLELQNENQYIGEGRVMQKYQDGWAKRYMRLGFETDFEGLNCFALNLGMCSSNYFDSVAHKDYDVLIAYAFNGDSYAFKLFSTKVNVSEIAIKYGGGGHKGAAGFESKTIPFSKRS